MQNDLRSYVERLRVAEHPDNDRRFIELLIMAIENPHSFSAIFNPQDLDQAHAKKAMEILVAEFRLSRTIRYLDSLGIRD